MYLIRLGHGSSREQYKSRARSIAGGTVYTHGGDSSRHLDFDDYSTLMRKASNTYVTRAEPFQLVPSIERILCILRYIGRLHICIVIDK